jgi:hypothetical protein
LTSPIRPLAMRHDLGVSAPIHSKPAFGYARG